MILLCYRIMRLWFCNKIFYNKKVALFMLDLVFWQTRIYWKAAILKIIRNLKFSSYSLYSMLKLLFLSLSLSQNAEQCSAWMQYHFKFHNQAQGAQCRSYVAVHDITNTDSFWCLLILCPKVLTKMALVFPLTWLKCGQLLTVGPRPSFVTMYI